MYKIVAVGIPIGLYALDWISIHIMMGWLVTIGVLLIVDYLKG